VSGFFGVDQADGYGCQCEDCNGYRWVFWDDWDCYFDYADLHGVEREKYDWIADDSYGFAWCWNITCSVCESILDDGPSNGLIGWRRFCLVVKVDEVPHCGLDVVCGPLFVVENVVDNVPSLVFECSIWRIEA
jgi:hypothetical protein